MQQRVACVVRGLAALRVAVEVERCSSTGLQVSVLMCTATCPPACRQYHGHAKGVLGMSCARPMCPCAHQTTVPHTPPAGSTTGTPRACWACRGARRTPPSSSPPPRTTAPSAGMSTRVRCWPQGFAWRFGCWLAVDKHTFCWDIASGELLLAAVLQAADWLRHRFAGCRPPKIHPARRAALRAPPRAAACSSQCEACLPCPCTHPPTHRVLCFAPSPVGEVYCELPPGSNWNFDVQWAPGQVRVVFSVRAFSLGPMVCQMKVSI